VPELCESTTVARPDAQVWVFDPPLPAMLTVRSVEVAEMVKVPPVEFESVTATLPALMTTWSATDPVATVRNVGGVVSQTWPFEVYVTGAAQAQKGMRAERQSTDVRVRCFIGNSWLLLRADVPR
jgi:hypothetical protein